MAISRLLLAVLFVAAGANHFISPAPYLAIMPPVLPWPEALVASSGVAEVLGGLGILWQPTRRLAGFGLLALLVAVFPANVYAAMNGMQFGGRAVPAWLLWARLPLQVVLLAWVHYACTRRQP
ncbi:MAG: DoxX family protein [Chthoniobacterales bacterium]